MKQTRTMASATAVLLMAVLLCGCVAANEATTLPPTTQPIDTTASTLPATDDRRPVILDYSPTVSDIGALAFLASRPELQLIAVTLPGTGESYCEPGVAHTRGVLEELRLGDVPVACGPDVPLTGWNAFPTSWRVASNEMDLPTAPPNEVRAAPQLLVDLIVVADRPVEIVAVGPLTNLAIALEQQPQIAANIAGITIMGGAIDVPGNVMRNAVGEWNVWVDPTAAALVMASGVPITLVPLDATNYLPTGRIFWESLDAAATTPAARVVRDVWAASEVWIDNPGGFYFWDELAAAVLIDGSLVEFESRRLIVEDTTRENKGWTRQDPSGSEVRIAVSADRRRFEQFFIDSLVGAPARLGYLVPTAAETTYFEALAAIEAAAGAAMDAILTATAVELGLEDGWDEDAFFGVVATALPNILSGPWAAREDAIGSIDAPLTMAVEHAQYLAALGDFGAAGSEIGAIVEAEDFTAFERYLGPITEACLALQRAAAIRLIAIDLACG